MGILRQGVSIIDGEFLGWSSRTANAGRFHSYAKPTMVTVNVGWYTDGADARVVVAVDGVTLMTTIRSGSDEFGILTLGARGNAFNGGLGGLVPMIGAGHWIRNVQVSTKAPTVPALTSGSNESIAILSDSIIGSDNWEAHSYYDCNYDAQILRRLELNNIRPTHFYRMTAGGHLLTELADGNTTYSFRVGNTATQQANLDDTVSTSVPQVDADVRGLVKALGYKTIVINGGSNDIGTAAVTVELFTAALKEYIEYFCGLNGQTAPSVVPSRILITNIADRGYGWNASSAVTGTLNGTTTVSSVSVPATFADGDRIGGYSTGSLQIPEDTTVVSGGGTATLVLSRAAVGSGSVTLYNLAEQGSSTARVKAATFRTAINTIPAWFTANYPSSPTQIVVADIFTVSGGTALYNGKTHADGVHPGYAQTLLIGSCIGYALL